MPTRKGWGVVVGSVLLLIAGRLFGLVELYALAGTGLLLVAATVLFVRAVRPAVETTRELHPPRVHAGSSSRVDLALRNVGRRRTPVLQVRDPFDGGWRSARFLVAPVAPGTVSRAAYRLPTDQRGVFDVGPLEVVVADPFGLASRRQESAGITQLTVFPRIDGVQAPPRTPGNDPHGGVDARNPLLGGGEDFFALRQYVEGDDLRRVHWRSTARLDELMIRQDEMPWQSRVTLLLDSRAKVHGDESLELAVSATASVLDVCRRQRSLVRLVTTDGVDSGFAAGAAHDDAVLERLAVLDATRTDRLAAAATMLRRGDNGGALVAFTTAKASNADLEAIASLRGRFGAVWLVLFEPSAVDPSPAARMLPPRAVPGGTRLVRVTADRPFARAWDDALAADAAGARR